MMSGKLAIHKYYLNFIVIEKDLNSYNNSTV